ncbi:MAG: hypothetical protein H0T47_24530 [Planctomycetaceae bacterium]|nr:hypothetical protein [Planctomycetaceae bacterium]
MSVLRRRVRRRVISVVLSGVLLMAGGTARGQDFFKNLIQAFGFGGGAEAEAVEVVIDVAPGFAGDEGPFVPQIKTLLGTELHFVRKVCKPDDAQMEAIRKAGLAEVETIAKRFAAAQQQNRRDGWPDARMGLSQALRRKIVDVMPTEAAKRYDDELTARKEARTEAAAEMMTTLVDGKVSLLPKQYEEVTAAVLANWQDAWARDLQLFLYEDFAPVPDLQAINGVLTERQRNLWRGGHQRGRIFFGWEHELGLDWGGQIELGRDLLVKKPDPEAVEAQKPQAGEASETVGEQVR